MAQPNTLNHTAIIKAIQPLQKLYKPPSHPKESHFSTHSIPSTVFHTASNKHINLQYKALAQQTSVKMKFTFALISLLAGIAMATPAAVRSDQTNTLETRGFDCKKCRCSSAEACTVSSTQPIPSAILRIA